MPARRELPIEEFYLDVGKTAVGPYEIATECVSLTSGRFGLAFRACHDRRTLAINAAVSVTLRDGLCVQARIARSVAPTPIRRHRRKPCSKERPV